jgi:hypothetical protein
MLQNCTTFYPSNTQQCISFTVLHLGYMFRNKGLFLRLSLLFVAIPFDVIIQIFFNNVHIHSQNYYASQQSQYNLLCYACYSKSYYVLPFNIQVWNVYHNTLNYMLRINDHSMHRPVT